MLRDLTEINKKGLFQGFNNSVVLLIMIQSIGGILTSIVIKYAGNILKNFATTISIIITILISLIIFENYELDAYCMVGTTTIIIATLIYGIKPIALVEKNIRRRSFIKVTTEVVN